MFSRFPRRTALRRAVALLGLLWLALASAALAETPDNPALVDQLELGERLGVLPGVASSAAAGLLNPAAWAVQRSGGLYLAWTEPEGDPNPDMDFADLTGVANFGALGFGLRYRALDDASHYAYTLGLSGGDKSHATGLSYTWTRGAEASFGQHSLLTAGSIHRWERLSVGLAGSYDFDAEHSLYQADLGLRPIGPRLTLFAGAGYIAPRVEDEDFDELAFSYGVEARLLPGLDVAALARDTGELSLRVDVALGGGKPGGEPMRTAAGARFHLDDEQEHAATTYTLETMAGPHLGLLFAKPKHYPELDLGGEIAYRGYRFFDERRRFFDLLTELSGLATDPSVAGVVLNLSNLQATPANLWELRAQLAGLRAQGKKVIVYFDRAGIPLYMLATVADQLWMDPQGDLDIKGLALGRTYYRTMLDKMGVGIDEWRFFTYKSAMESFSRTSMSDADREQFTAFMEDFYAAGVSLVLESRGLSRAAWDQLVNEKAELIPEEALAAGLVDKLGDYHEAKDGAKDAPRRTSSDSAAAELTALLGDRVWGPEAWGEPKRIALLYAIGECAMDTGIKGRQLSKTIREVREDERVAAVVMRADSPGGDPLPSDLVSRELKATEAEKPVFVSQGQVAGSGGYWISMHSTAIYASPFTITGSIGVISAHLWDNGLGEKIGMDYDHVQIGAHADYNSGPALPLIGMSIPYRPVTPEERARGESVMRTLYRDFTEQVAAGRGMTPEAVDAVGQGRIWSGEDGLAKGLVDRIDGLWGSLVAAKRAAGIPDASPVRFVEAPSLGAFDFGFLTPDIPGLGLLARLGAGESAPEPLLAGEPWSRLPAAERGYLEQVVAAKGAPLVTMPPLALEGLQLAP
jgi:protease-4